MAVKQVLIMRQFPSLRTGKYCSQAAHASVGALLSCGTIIGECLVIPMTDPFIKEWLTGSFRKITLYVKVEESLIEIFNQAQEKGLPVSMIHDSGLTEFNNVRTLTAVGIGPAEDSLIDSITGKLPLF